jgi:hypothetical protein
MTLGAVVLDIFRLCGTPKSYKNVFENISKNLINGTVGTLNGVLSILTGTIRFLTSPLTYLIKPIVRLGVCLMLLQSGGQRPIIENNDGIQSRVKIAENQTGDDAIQTCADIHRKFKKCLEREETTNVNKATEQATFSKLAQVKGDTNQLQIVTVAYLNLFAKPPIVPDAAHEESHLLSSAASYS